MIYKYRILKKVETQVVQVAEWYNERNEGLGEELILCFEAGIQQVIRNPFYRVRYKNFRAINIRHFPYKLIYFVEENRVTFVSFKHSKSNSKYFG